MKIIWELVQNAGSADFLLFRENHFVGPFELPFIDSGERFDHHGDLDGARGTHALVRVERVGFAGVEVLRVETDFAFERVDDGFYLFVEGGLGLYGSRDRN